MMVASTGFAEKSNTTDRSGGQDDILQHLQRPIFPAGPRRKQERSRKCHKKIETRPKRDTTSLPSDYKIMYYHGHHLVYYYFFILYHIFRLPIIDIFTKSAQPHRISTFPLAIKKAEGTRYACLDGIRTR